MRDFSRVKRVVIKIGSSSLVHEDLSPNYEIVESLIQSCSLLKKKGMDVAIVSSGAIALGRYALGLSQKPKEMALKQACAAIGQAKLMEVYNSIAQRYNLFCGQILINHDDFQIRKRMLYLSDTLEAMFKNNVIPIINENDALAVDEIRVGDNDTLASLIAPMVDAKLLILFSDINGLYNKNPKQYKDAYMLHTVDKIDQSIFDMVDVNDSDVGTGGMRTKINAAIISTNACCNMLICNASEIPNLLQIIDGNEIGTLFTAKLKGISSKEHWMIFKTHSCGKIIVDAGCVLALKNKKVSILPKGIIDVEGDFLRNSVVEICTIEKVSICKGITNYSSSEIYLILGLDTQDAKEKLGYSGKNEVVHANNMVILREDMLC